MTLCGRVFRAVLRHSYRRGWADLRRRQLLQSTFFQGNLLFAEGCKECMSPWPTDWLRRRRSGRMQRTPAQGSGLQRFGHKGFRRFFKCHRPRSWDCVPSSFPEHQAPRMLAAGKYPGSSFTWAAVELPTLAGLLTLLSRAPLNSVVRQLDQGSQS